MVEYVRIKCNHYKTRGVKGPVLVFLVSEQCLSWPTSIVGTSMSLWQSFALARASCHLSVAEPC